LATAGQHLPTDIADAEWNAGGTLEFDQIIDDALSLPARIASPASNRRGMTFTKSSAGHGIRPGHHQLMLTAREREVALLVSRGLTNREVADQLVVTQRTVETHLERIFAKLDIHSRTQLTYWISRQQSESDASWSTNEN